MAIGFLTIQTSKSIDFFLCNKAMQTNVGVIEIRVSVCIVWSLYIKNKPRVSLVPCE